MNALARWIAKRINWGALVPKILRDVGEGKYGETPKRLYWFAAGKKTFIGAFLLALGAGLETVCAGYPDMAWACEASRWVYYTGAVLTSVGLVDGGTRAPWPPPPQVKG